jgi:hypothetical protein
MSDPLLLGAAALATGLVGGFISGLFGVGGGIVIVPVLDTALGSLGVDSTVRMQVAVATSLATIVPTSDRLGARSPSPWCRRSRACAALGAGADRGRRCGKLAC